MADMMIVVYASAAGAVLGISLWLRRTFLHLRAEREKLLDSWRSLESVIAKRNALLPEVLAAFEPREGAANDLIGTLNALREQSQAQLLQGDLRQLSDTEKAILETVRSLRRFLETSEELRAQTAISPVCQQLSEMEERLCEQRERYNVAVNQFNQSLKRFPNGLIAAVSRLQECDYLEARRYAR